MFEKLEIPAIFLSKDAVLECFASGRTSGLVVDLGSSGTVVSPVYDGWVEMKGLNRSVIGSRLMDHYLLQILTGSLLQGNPPKPSYRLHKTVADDGITTITKLRTNLINIHPAYDHYMCLEIARDIKETQCRVPETPLSESESKLSTSPSSYYMLPDGTGIELGIERFKPSELLFDHTNIDIHTLLHSSSPVSVDKSIVPASSDPLQRIICDAILRCDVDIQSSLFSSLIISGGGSCMEGIAERMKAEVELIIHPVAPGWRVKYTTLGKAERAISAWLGGSILASLGSFHEMWMTKQEYQEHGSSLVDRKCP